MSEEGGMDWYTSYLLSRAVEAVESRYGPNPDFFIYRGVTDSDDGSVVWELSNPFFRYEAPTLADALMALLDDLSVEYEARPSAERINDLGLAPVSSEAGSFHTFVEALPYLRDLYAREPLTVLALLSGGES